MLEDFLEKINKRKQEYYKTPANNHLPNYIAAIGLLSVVAIIIFSIWWITSLDLIPSIGTSASLISLTWAINATWKWYDKH